MLLGIISPKAVNLMAFFLLLCNINIIPKGVHTVLPLTSLLKVFVPNLLVFIYID